jgi:nicotinamidase-related amidase
MYAILIVDMINDFVYSKFGNERAQGIVPNILKLKNIADAKGWKVIYLQDSHKITDPEIKIWGEHAIAGSKGSDIIDELKPTESDIIIKKSTYNGFFNTDLEKVLKANNIKKLIFAGVSTDICVLNTAANAFFLGFEILVCRDCTESINEESKEMGLDYLEKIYGAKIFDIKQVGVI